MRYFLLALPRRFFVLAMLGGSALITAMSLVYFDFGTLPPFAIEKFPLRFESLWLVSLRIHVASALVALPLCLLLTTRTLQRRPAWHRVLGRLAGIITLAGVVPTGLVLAFDAKGGAFVTAGFLVSAAIVAWGVVHGVASARRGELVRHRRAMRHVVAQMSVAVTSRVLIVALDVAGIDPEVSYVLALWGPVLASALAAELASRPSTLRFTPAHPFERIRREISPSALLVRARAVRPVARTRR
ncbi:MAG TPA: DUF2306 domain-containing protein [Polyangiaceae bacterium]